MTELISSAQEFAPGEFHSVKLIIGGSPFLEYLSVYSGTRWPSASLLFPLLADEPSYY
jgi:hypothetical protein